MSGESKWVTILCLYCPRNPAGHMLPDAGATNMIQPRDFPGVCPTNLKMLRVDGDAVLPNDLFPCSGIIQDAQHTEIIVRI